MGRDCLVLMSVERLMVHIPKRIRIVIKHCTFLNILVPNLCSDLFIKLNSTISYSQHSFQMTPVQILQII